MLNNDIVAWDILFMCRIRKYISRLKFPLFLTGQCKECKNFNSMFAILSGLGHGTVSRLKQTWERLPSKYQRMFHDMQDLMDPSRNMSKYRNLVQSENIQSPIVRTKTFVLLSLDVFISLVIVYLLLLLHFLDLTSSFFQVIFVFLNFNNNC